MTRVTNAGDWGALRDGSSDPRDNAGCSMKGGRAMGEREWLTCWAVILLAAFLSQAGCGDDKCPSGTKGTDPGVCHVPDRSGTGSAGGAVTRADSGSIEIIGSARDAGAGGSVAVGTAGWHGGDSGKAEHVDAGSDAETPDSSHPKPPSADAGERMDAGSSTPTAGMSAPPPFDGGSEPMTAGMVAPPIPAPRCGDGRVDQGETCDGNCPASCDDGDVCTTDALAGSVADCDAVCRHTPITAAKGGDGCCPSDADATNDSDCKATCGNGVVEPGELCDGKCPAACANNDPCTTTKYTGSAKTCDAACVTTPITQPKNNDGCCTPGANAGTDNDCPQSCGDGVVTGDETCDPKDKDGCPWQCPALHVCMLNTMTGSANTCDVKCAEKQAPAGATCDVGATCDAAGKCSAPVHSKKLYDSCSSDADCDQSICVDKICTQKCNVAADCPGSSVGCFQHWNSVTGETFYVCRIHCTDSHGCVSGQNQICQGYVDDSVPNEPNDPGSCRPLS